MPPEYYPQVDHVHHIAPWAHDDALAFGIPGSRMTMIPCGMHPARFRIEADRRTLRRTHAVPDGTFVILSVSAVNRHHKRVDHLIEEVSRLDGDVLLWIDGNPEDPAVLDLARRRLGERCRITHVPSETIPELYGLADVMALASLTESFGIAVIEALGTGLFVLAHDSPHFEWMVEDRACLVDMGTPGRLADRLRELMGRREALRCPARADRARRRFDWMALKPDYLEMYRKVATAGAATARRARVGQTADSR
jgi:glycosyltransferase involved in cell wall biosynthesis